MDTHFSSTTWRGYSYLVLLLLSTLLPLRAQTWSADLSGSGEPPSPTWRLDRSHFQIQDGTLVLHAPRPRARGLSVISTSTILPEHPRFEGRLRWQVAPTSANCSYVLLCCLSEEGGKYDYIALAVGGEHHGVSLVRLSLQLLPDGSSPRIKYRETKELIVEEGTATSHVECIDYRVDYRPGVGWRLEVSLPDKGSDWLEIGTSEEPQVELPKQNSLAWICQYSPKNNEAWRLSRLKISSLLGGQTQPPEHDPTPKPKPEPEPEPTPRIDPSEGRHIILSEVMAHPTAEGEEYIELYNPTTEPLSLTPYRLVVGRSAESIHVVTLPDVSLLPRSFVVLTKNASMVMELYSLPAQGVLEVDLPRLIDKAGVVGLINEQGETIDACQYDTSRLPRGMKSKAGIAWERVDPLSDDDSGKNWRPARASHGYATPGKANSLWSHGRGGTDEGEGFREAQGTTTPADLLQELRSHTDYQVSWRIYDLLGRLLALRDEGTHPTDLSTLLEHPRETLEALLGMRRGLFLLEVKLLTPEPSVIRRTIKLYRP